MHYYFNYYSVFAPFSWSTPQRLVSSILLASCSELYVAIDIYFKHVGDQFIPIG